MNKKCPVKILNRIVKEDNDILKVLDDVKITSSLLMEEEVKIRFNLDMYSANDVMNNKEKYIERIRELLYKLGFNETNKVSIRVRKELESENYHCLNMAIQELGLGDGDF